MAASDRHRNLAVANQAYILPYPGKNSNGAIKRKNTS
jgi:hypothetical protein